MLSCLRVPQSDTEAALILLRGVVSLHRPRRHIAAHIVPPLSFRTFRLGGRPVHSTSSCGRFAVRFKLVILALQGPKMSVHHLPDLSAIGTRVSPDLEEVIDEDCDSRLIPARARAAAEIETKGFGGAALAFFARPTAYLTRLGNAVLWERRSVILTTHEIPSMRLNICLRNTE